jgi:hypothetical protein
MGATQLSRAAPAAEPEISEMETDPVFGPYEVGAQKYDATAASMIALLRYGSGFPWNRLERLQQGLDIPLPAATECQIMAETAVPLGPAHEELIRQAAQGGLFHNDDTSMRVLALNKAQARAADSGRERTGVFTSGIISLAPGKDIALFFTGRQHAGENLRDVLKRASGRVERPHSNVRRSLTQSAQASEGAGNHRGSLPSSFTAAALCGGDAELP